MSPALDRMTSRGLTVLTDTALRESEDIVVAFTERTGGESVSPYEGLNLAAHVGDAAEAVDRNRTVLLEALGLGGLRERLTTAEQVHGATVTVVDADSAGRGAFAQAGPPPIEATDALVTLEPDVPLLMFFADCLPVVIVAPGGQPGVAVAHCGWRGAAAHVARSAALALSATTGCDTSELLVYMGPAIGPCHYAVGPDVLSHFADSSDNISARRGGLDLGAVVLEDLGEIGVRTVNTVRSDVCTAERTESFYSFRAEGVTGRHGALAVLGQGR